MSSHPPRKLGPGHFYFKEVKMINESKIRSSFQRVRKDIDMLKYDAFNNIRYLNVKVKEQGIMIRELERRLAQVERISLRENLVR
jgi:hypothetical protein